jgi:hypothetical protein
MLVYLRGGSGNTTWCLFAHLLVFWMSPKNVWSPHLVTQELSCFLSVTWHGETLYSLGGSGCWHFDYSWCFFSAKCGFSISARLLIYGAHAVCFCTLVSVLELSKLFLCEILTLLSSLYILLFSKFFLLILFNLWLDFFLFFFFYIFPFYPFFLPSSPFFFLVLIILFCNFSVYSVLTFLFLFYYCSCFKLVFTVFLYFFLCCYCDCSTGDWVWHLEYLSGCFSAKITPYPGWEKLHCPIE